VHTRDAVRFFASGHAEGESLVQATEDTINSLTHSLIDLLPLFEVGLDGERSIHGDRDRPGQS